MKLAEYIEAFKENPEQLKLLVLMLDRKVADIDKLIEEQTDG